MKKWKNIILTVVVIAVLTTSTTVSALAQKTDYAGILTTMIDSDILTLNPWFWGMYNEKQVLDHIYDSLVRYDVNNEPVPALCSAWQHSADLTTWNFTLRSDAYWHDGQTVDADDVVWTWQTLIDDTGIPRRSWLYDNVVSITKLSQFSIELVLDYGPKAVDFLVEIGTDWILPEHIWNTIDIYDFTNDNPIGCGPFKFISRTPAVQITLARHADYHLDGPWVNEKIIKIIPDQATAFFNLNTSVIEVLSDSTVSQENYAKTDPDIAIHQILQDFWMYLTLNQRRYPNNITEFRQAVLHGINRSEIIDIAHYGRGEIMPASCCLPWGEYYNPSATEYGYDVVAANLILDNLGFLDNIGSDGIREDGLGNPLEFELIVSAEYSDSVATATLIAGYMLDIGIDVTVSPILWSILWQRVGGTGDAANTWDYDWAFLGWSSFWSDFHPSWADWLFSVNGWWGSDDINIPGWNSSIRWDVNQLIDEIRYETASSVVKAKLNLIQELVANDLPYLPMNVAGTVTLYRIDEFEDWTMGNVKGPDCWESWLTVHLIGVPTIYEYMHLAGILAALVIGFLLLTKFKNRYKRR